MSPKYLGYSHMNEIKSTISKFDAISLVETNAKAALLERMDTKYIFRLDMLPSILEACRENYDILEINGTRLLTYETTYFDTNLLYYFHAHHAGHGNRLKVRIRRYNDHGDSYLEIKHKNNKGITQKKRTVYSEKLPISTQLKDSQFIHQQPLIKNNLEETLLIRYKRITLVSKVCKERVTIDCQINFSNAASQVSMPEYTVAEVKQAKSRPSHFTKLMRSKNIRQGGISKYCLGVIGLYQHAKTNRFKPFLHKLNNQSIDYGNASNRG